ncbi:hypothetical protein B0J14DRAFT_590175 [Halenospora varia]|nr:hypothetical protein B0J14DRAFT_590175 [Halenospora varia]
MRFSSKLVAWVAFALATGEIAWAGPGGSVALINATPYDWKLVNSHQYQMDWRPAETIPAGTSHMQYFEYWYQHGDNGDCAAEATYAIENGPTPAQFIVQARQNGGKRIEVQYQDTMASLNNPQNSLINLGYIHDGAVSFILSGTDTSNYVGTNPPIAWMQATLSTIGPKTMRDIAIPESHDAGASELTWQWMGIPHNTQTQAVHMYTQLLNGARWFDVRPVYYKGHWYTGHFSPSVGKNQIGATGRTIEHIINDINRFTSEHPGELIILDLTHDQNIDKWWAPLEPQEWQALYAELYKIKDLWIPTSDNLPDDLTTVPISTFISPGSKSAVVIRIPGGAPLPGETKHTGKREESSTETTIAHPAEGVHMVFNNVDPEENPRIDTINDFGDYENAADARWTTGSSAASNITQMPSKIKIMSNKVLAPLPEGPWRKAFIHDNRFHYTGSYSETRWPEKMTPDQIAKLGSKGSEPLRSTWTLTQYWTDVTDVATERHSIIYMARKAHKALLEALWPAMKEGGKWPNIIEIDDVSRSDAAALSIAINNYFAAGNNHALVKRPKVAARSMRRGWRRDIIGTPAKNPSCTSFWCFLEDLQDFGNLCNFPGACPNHPFEDKQKHWDARLHSQWERDQAWGALLRVRAPRIAQNEGERKFLRGKFKTESKALKDPHKVTLKSLSEYQKKVEKTMLAKADERWKELGKRHKTALDASKAKQKKLLDTFVAEQKSNKEINKNDREKNFSDYKSALKEKMDALLATQKEQSAALRKHLDEYMLPFLTFSAAKHKALSDRYFEEERKQDEHHSAKFRELIKCQTKRWDDEEDKFQWVPGKYSPEEVANYPRLPSCVPDISDSPKFGSEKDQDWPDPKGTVVVDAPAELESGLGIEEVKDPEPPAPYSHPGRYGPPGATPSMVGFPTTSEVVSSPTVEELEPSVTEIEVVVSSTEEPIYTEPPCMPHWDPPSTEFGVNPFGDTPCGETPFGTNPFGTNPMGVSA